MCGHICDCRGSVWVRELSIGNNDLNAIVGALSIQRWLVLDRNGYKSELLKYSCAAKVLIVAIGTWCSLTGISIMIHHEAVPSATSSVSTTPEFFGAENLKLSTYITFHPV